MKDQLLTYTVESSGRIVHMFVGTIFSSALPQDDPSHQHGFAVIRGGVSIVVIRPAWHVQSVPNDVARN